MQGRQPEPEGGEGGERMNWYYENKKREARIGGRYSRAPKSVKDKFRDSLEALYGSNCWLCSLPLGEDKTVEHIRAQIHHGKTKSSNCRLVHKECNSALGARPVKEKWKWRQQLEKWATWLTSD
jgi:hypothetical protein